jgi:type II protein arginine methyltransferase
MHSAVTIATSLSLDDIARAPTTDKKGHPHSPVLKLKADARSKGYQTVVLPLTTNKWRERWTETCLLPEGQLESIDAMADHRAEVWRSQPAFLPGEVTMTGLGEWLNHLLAFFGVDWGMRR